MRVVTTYEPVRVQVTKAMPCPACGRKVRRQRTFQQTINPWNKNADGTVKTSFEVLRAVRIQAKEWQEQPETCASHKEIPA